MKNQYALITGASAGIGKDFALQLAAQGHSLILVARREQTLKALCDEIKGTYSVDCQYLAIDLSEAYATAQIANHCRNNQLQVNMLINNAGYGVPGDFDVVDWLTHQKMLQVMLVSLTELCREFYPAMKERQQGRIINVASLAGLTPATAGHTLYGAVKSYVIKFSHSLHLEAKEHGVHVTALCPGFTYTEFHDVNGTRSMVSKMSKKLWMDSSEVVAQGLLANEKNQAIKVNGWRNQAIAALSKYLPDFVIRFLMKGSVAKFRKR